jgi:hypothetical protein
MNKIESQGEHIAHHETLHVEVRYLAVKDPYKDHSAKSSETLATLKARVLLHFGLEEGNVDGGRKEYFLVYEGVQLTDLAIALGTLAKEKRHLDMKLIEHFIQG